jgi:hypothetical protein
MNKVQPEHIADYFFKSLLQNQCHVCWSLFSKHTQDHFAQWCLESIYERTPEAAKFSNLGIPEVKLLLEKNDSMLMKTFWKRFYISSNAADFYRFGYYETIQNDGKQALVGVMFRYPNGKTTQLTLTMVNEKGAWKLGYLESKLPF